MAFHFSRFGMFGNNLPCDIDGYVPEQNDSPWEFNVDHGYERTHDDDGNLTDYGRWWETEGFPQWVEEAVKETKKAERQLRKWRGL